MLDYIKKFEELPDGIKARMSSTKVMMAIDDLEKRYRIDLAPIVIKVLVKDITINSLDGFFSKELNIDHVEAGKLVQELKQNVFNEAADWLGLAFNVTQAPPRKPRIEPESKEAIMGKGVNFFLYPEDEEDIKSLAQKAGELQKINSNNLITEQIEEISKKVNINFGSEALLIRFKNILRTFLKGVRDSIETKQAMMKAFEEGGLGFDFESADKVLIVAKGVKEGQAIQIPSMRSPRLRVPEDDNQKKEIIINEDKKQEEYLSSLKKIGARDVEYDLKKSLEAKKELAEKKSPEKLEGDIHEDEIEDIEFEVPDSKEDKYKPTAKNVDLSQVLADMDKSEVPSTGSPSASSGQVSSVGSGEGDSKIAPEVETKLKEKEASLRNTEKKILPSSGPVPSIRPGQKETVINNKPKILLDAPRINKPSKKFRTPTQVGGKKMISDVTFEPKALDPINELRYLDLVTFRRYGPDAETRVNKIRDKIKLLEEENYTRRIDGIRAWRTSPVNNLYIKLGHESISKTMPINAIIEEREKKHEDFLSQDEFDAIMDLNREIRY